MLAAGKRKPAGATNTAPASNGQAAIGGQLPKYSALLPQAPSCGFEQYLAQLADQFRADGDRPGYLAARRVLLLIQAARLAAERGGQP